MSKLIKTIIFISCLVTNHSLFSFKKGPATLTANQVKKLKQTKPQTRPKIISSSKTEPKWLKEEEAFGDMKQEKKLGGQNAENLYGASEEKNVETEEELSYGPGIEDEFSQIGKQEEFYDMEDTEAYDERELGEEEYNKLEDEQDFDQPIEE